jgi:predicted nucleotidyltransferase
MSLNEYCRTAIEHYTGKGAPPASGAGGAQPWVDAARSVAGDCLDAVVLFGSEARGEARESSDTDLLIVIAGILDLNRDLYHQWDRLDIGPRVSPHFVHLPESVSVAGSIWFETALDGIVLFERDHSVSLFLQTVRHAIADGELRRRYAACRAYPATKKTPKQLPHVNSRLAATRCTRIVWATSSELRRPLSPSPPNVRCE